MYVGVCHASGMQVSYFVHPVHAGGVGLATVLQESS